MYNCGETAQTNGCGYEAACGASASAASRRRQRQRHTRRRYVVSAIEETVRHFLAAYGMPGTKCSAVLSQKKHRRGALS